MDRTNYIGGSDIAAIVGLSPWRSPLDVYLEKTGQAAPAVVNDAMRWGTLLEPTIIAEYSRATGRPVRKRKQPYVHPVYKYIAGHVDGIVVKTRRVVEAKAVAREWEDVPDYYQTQVQWYMHLAKADAADVAALIAGQRLRIYEVQEDRDAQRMLIEAAIEFWERHVEARVPPPPRSEGDVQKLWSAKNGKQIVSTSEIEQLVREIAQIREQIASLEASEQERRNRIAIYMQDATELIAPNGDVLLSYGAYTRKSTDWQQVVQRLSAKLPIDEVGQIVGECTVEKEVRTMRTKLKNGE